MHSQEAIARVQIREDEDLLQGGPTSWEEGQRKISHTHTNLTWEKERGVSKEVHVRGEAYVRRGLTSL